MNTKNRIKLNQIICLAGILFIFTSCTYSVIKLKADLNSNDPEKRRDAAIELSSHFGNISKNQLCTENGICIQLDTITANILGNELIKCLSDTDTWVRINALRGLADLKFKKGSPYIIEKLNDPDEIAKEDAVSALGELKYKSAVPSLIKMLKESSAKDGYISEVIMEALGKIGDTSATLSIVTFLNKSDNSRNLATGMQALVNLKDKRLLEIIHSNTNNPDEFVNSLPVEALGNLESEVAIPNLLNSLNTFDIAKNRDPAEVLARYSDKVLDQLLLESKDGNIYSRSGAIYSIGLIGSEKTLDHLIEMLKDENDIIKFSAMCALENKNYKKRGINKLADLSRNNSGMTGLLADMLLCEAYDSLYFFSDYYSKLDLLRLNSFNDEELIYGAVSYSHYAELSYAIPFLINLLDNNANLLWVPQGESSTSKNAKPTTPSDEAYQVLILRLSKFKDADNLPKDKVIWQNWWKKHEGEYRNKLQSFWQNKMASKGR